MARALTVVDGESVGGVELDDLISHETPLAIKFPNGQKLSVVYDPHELNVGELAELLSRPDSDLEDHEGDDEAARAAKRAERVRRVLTAARDVCRVVRSWDLVIKGVSVPLEVDAVSRLPLKLLSFILRKIGEDQNVDPK